MSREVQFCVLLLGLCFTSSCSFLFPEAALSDEEMPADSIAVTDIIAESVSTPISSPSEGDWWVPPPGTTWQWQLSGEVDTTYEVQMYDIDLIEVPMEVIEQLHTDGRIVVCYFSAGSWEDWREDAGDFPDVVLGKTLAGWKDERWSEQCFEYDECELLLPFIDAGKAVFGVEYDLNPESFCSQANQMGFSWLQKKLELDSWMIPCWLE